MKRNNYNLTGTTIRRRNFIQEVTSWFLFLLMASIPVLLMDRLLAYSLDFFLKMGR